MLVLLFQVKMADLSTSNFSVRRCEQTKRRLRRAGIIQRAERAGWAFEATSRRRSRQFKSLSTLYFPSSTSMFVCARA
jgi:hypothetical protein